MTQEYLIVSCQFKGQFTKKGTRGGHRVRGERTGKNENNTASENRKKGSQPRVTGLGQVHFGQVTSITLADRVGAK